MDSSPLDNKEKKEEKKQIYFTPYQHSTITSEKSFDAPRKNVKLYAAARAENQEIQDTIKSSFSQAKHFLTRIKASTSKLISQQDLDGLDCDFLPSSPPLPSQRQMSSSDDSMPELSTPSPPRFKPKPYKAPIPTDLDQVCNKLEKFKVTAEIEPSKKRFKKSQSPTGQSHAKDESSTSSSSTPDSLKNVGLMAVGSDWTDTTPDSCPDLVSLTDLSDISCSYSEKGKGKGKTTTAPEPKPRYCQMKELERPIPPIRWSKLKTKDKTETKTETETETETEKKTETETEIDIETETETESKTEAETKAVSKAENYTSTKQIALIRPYAESPRNTCTKKLKKRGWWQDFDGEWAPEGFRLARTQTLGRNYVPITPPKDKNHPKKTITTRIEEHKTTKSPSAVFVCKKVTTKTENSFD